MTVEHPAPFPLIAVGDKGFWPWRAQWWLAKNRWGVNFNPGPVDSFFGPQSGRAAQRAKWYLGYPLDACDPFFGPALHAFLVPHDNPHFKAQTFDMWRRRVYRKGKANPFAEHAISGKPWPFRSRAIGDLNGCPYQGTHAHPSPSDPMHNWESQNAVDLNAPYGTVVIAIWDGTIGDQLGPIISSDPHLLGQRLHLRRLDGANEAYYAHLSRIDVARGQHINRGQQLGLSGSANTVAHLHIAVERGRPQDILGIDGCG